MIIIMWVASSSFMLNAQLHALDKCVVYMWRLIIVHSDGYLCTAMNKGKFQQLQISPLSFFLNGSVRLTHRTDTDNCSRYLGLKNPHAVVTISSWFSWWDFHKLIIKKINGGDFFQPNEVDGDFVSSCSQLLPDFALLDPLEKTEKLRKYSRQVGASLKLIQSSGRSHGARAAVENSKSNVLNSESAFFSQGVPCV